MHFVFYILLVLLSGCVKPPTDLQPSIIDKEELDFLSYARRGKEYAKAGRMSQAELNFRKALQLNSQEDFIYNDLGFVLLGQNRSSEAIEMFRQAQELEPENLTALQNLARAYYGSNEVEKAVAVYEELVEKQIYFPFVNLSRTDIKPLSNKSLVEVFRNLSILYFVLGYTDESICFSKRALDRALDLDETVKHARLLLSLDKTRQAAEVLRATITVRRGEVPPELFLDYAVALVALEKYKLAKESLARLLSNERALQKSRTGARLMKFELALSTTEEEADEIFEELVDETPDVCDWNLESKFPYWPYIVHEPLHKSLEARCASIS